MKTPPRTEAQRETLDKKRFPIKEPNDSSEWEEYNQELQHQWWPIQRNGPVQNKIPPPHTTLPLQAKVWTEFQLSGIHRPRPQCNEDSTKIPSLYEVSYHYRHLNPRIMVNTSQWEYGSTHKAENNNVTASNKPKDWPQSEEDATIPNCFPESDTTLSKILPSLKSDTMLNKTPP